MPRVREETRRYWLESRPVENLTNGDFVVCFPLDRNRFAVVVGDVAGRGTVAARAACALGAYTRSVLLTAVPLRSALARIDAFFVRAVQCDEVAIATMALIVIDATDGVLEYASAGHEPALLFHDRERHERLLPTGPVLGLDGVAPSHFEQARAHFSDRSAIVIVTDGITEARHYDLVHPDFFGSDGVVRAFTDARYAGIDPARAIADAALRHARGITRDDATTLVVPLGPSETSRPWY